MRYTAFGRTGMRVSEIALGTGMLGATEDGTIDEAQAQAVLGAYLDAGGNLIDAAEAYQGGRSEEMIGEFLGGRREDVVLVSKYGRSTTRSASFGRVGSHRKAMVQSVEGSLQRLRTDRIDLYFVHLDDGVTPIEEIMRGLDDLVRAGKIIYAGLSNFPAWRMAQAATLAELRGWAPLAAIEVEYSLLQRGIEREILPLARDAGFGVMAYSALAGGALSGRDASGGPGVVGRRRPPIPPEVELEPVLAAVGAITKESGIDPAKVALAWVAAKGVIPILGARTAAHLTRNIGITEVALGIEQIRRLDQASAIRLGYPHELLAMVR